MKETTWILDAQTGVLTIEGLVQADLARPASDLLPHGEAVNCARPLPVPPVHSGARDAATSEPTLRVFRTIAAGW